MKSVFWLTDKELSRTQKVILWTIASVVLALALVFIVKFDSIVTGIGDYLIVNEPPQKSDVIIVLGGGTGDRITEGAKLYQAGYADKVLISGGNANANRYVKQQALSLGIPESAILVEDQSRSTWENAKFSFKIMQAQGYKSAIVVTSPYHTRRSSIMFDRVFKGMDVTICSVPYDPAMTHSWWRTSYSAHYVVSEYFKLAYHYLFDWN